MSHEDLYTWRNGGNVRLCSHITQRSMKNSCVAADWRFPKQRFEWDWLVLGLSVDVVWRCSDTPWCGGSVRITGSFKEDLRQCLPLRRENQHVETVKGAETCKIPSFRRKSVDCRKLVTSLVPAFSSSSRFIDVVNVATLEQTPVFAFCKDESFSISSLMHVVFLKSCLPSGAALHHLHQQCFHCYACNVTFPLCKCWTTTSYRVSHVSCTAAFHTQQLFGWSDWTVKAKKAFPVLQTVNLLEIRWGTTVFRSTRMWVKCTSWCTQKNLSWLSRLSCDRYGLTYIC